MVSCEPGQRLRNRTAIRVLTSCFALTDLLVGCTYKLYTPAMKAGSEEPSAAPKSLWHPKHEPPAYSRIGGRREALTTAHGHLGHRIQGPHAAKHSVVKYSFGVSGCVSVAV